MRSRLTLQRVRVIWEAAEPSLLRWQKIKTACKRAFLLTGAPPRYLLLVGANTRQSAIPLAMAAFALRSRCPGGWCFWQRRASRRGIALDWPAIWDCASSCLAERRAHQDVVTLLASCGALIHPSVWRRLGLLILEAMACGCPVVASDIPPFREIMARATVLSCRTTCQLSPRPK